jgi:UDP-glucose 4-epimerase
MARCLVTGGAGFIGSHLVEALLANGHTVRVLDNLSTGNLANLATVRDQIELVSGDLLDLEKVRAAAREIDYVYHQAALDSIPLSLMDPLATHHACATATLHVLVAAREAQVRRVIYGSTSRVYGNAAPLPTRENEPPQPLSLDAVAKLAGGEYCAVFQYIYGLETVRLCYFNVFGPRQSLGDPYSAIIPFFLEAMLAGKPPVIHGDGLQSRDFTYVADVVQANLLAMEAPRVAGRVYNIASGRRTTLLEVIDLLNEILEAHLKPIHDSESPGDIRHSQADISRAQIELGFCPCTELKANLRHCVDYYWGHFPKALNPPHRVGKDVILTT